MFQVLLFTGCSKMIPARQKFDDIHLKLFSRASRGLLATFGNPSNDQCCAQIVKAPHDNAQCVYDTPIRSHNQHRVEERLSGNVFTLQVESLEKFGFVLLTIVSMSCFTNSEGQSTNLKKEFLPVPFDSFFSFFKSKKKMWKMREFLSSGFLPSRDSHWVPLGMLLKAIFQTSS